MEKSNETKSLVESAIVEIYNCEKFAEYYFKKAQRVGLQGEKRRLRYFSTVCHNLKNYLPSDFYDLYGIALKECHPTVQVNENPLTIPEFFEKSLNFFESEYDAIHKISNSLIMSNSANYADKLMCICEKLAKYIKKYRRIKVEGESFGWGQEYIQRIMLLQHSLSDVHDKFKKKEEAIGYKF